jgi:hypothetical protein
MEEGLIAEQETSSDLVRQVGAAGLDPAPDRVDVMVEIQPDERAERSTHRVDEARRRQAAEEASEDDLARPNVRLQSLPEPRP